MRDFAKLSFKHLLLGLTAIATVIAVPLSAAAEQTAAGENGAGSATSTAVHEETEQNLEEKRKLLIEEAMTALDQTDMALEALDKGETENALDSLATVTGKLEIILARDPELALAPVDVNVVQRDVFGDVSSIRQARERIEELIEEGKIQEVRPLIRNFGSELVYEMLNLPLGTYPDAIKLAVRQIDRGDIEAAKETLDSALHTLVVTESRVPLPLVRAESLIGQAEAVLEKAEDAQANKDEPESMSPVEYVAGAREQLEMAEAFGYAENEDYTELWEDIAKLEERIESEEETEDIFASIADSFNELRSNIR